MFLKFRNQAPKSFVLEKAEIAWSWHSGNHCHHRKAPQDALRYPAGCPLCHRAGPTTPSHWEAELNCTTLLNDHCGQILSGGQKGNIHLSGLLPKILFLSLPPLHPILMPREKCLQRRKPQKQKPSAECAETAERHAGTAPGHVPFLTGSLWTRYMAGL